jgi:hypothetical protein
MLECHHLIIRFKKRNQSSFRSLVSFVTSSFMENFLSTSSTCKMYPCFPHTLPGSSSSRTAFLLQLFARMASLGYSERTWTIACSLLY